jgi:hypothetical protein
MARRTSSETLSSDPERTRETVAMLTPRLRAISFMVTAT